jgi:thioredoxin-related protein
VDWREDYVSALKEAKQTSRPVFILFTNTKTCPYCIEGDQKIFSRHYFNKFSKADVIPLKVDFAPLFGTGKRVTRADFDRIQAEAKVPKEIKSESWPFVVLVSSDGKILHQETERGNTNPRKFVEKYQEIISQSAAQ